MFPEFHLEASFAQMAFNELVQGMFGSTLPAPARRRRWIRPPIPIASEDRRAGGSLLQRISTTTVFVRAMPFGADGSSMMPSKAKRNGAWIPTGAVD